MTGLKHHRIAKNLSLKELATLAETSRFTIENYENPDSAQNGNSEIYLRLANALEVTIDELLRPDYPELDDPKAGREGKRRSATANPMNPITVYRDAHGLTFMQIATLIGNTTKESGRKACAAQQPLERHINALAVKEGISADEFRALYSPENIRTRNGRV